MLKREKHLTKIKESAETVKAHQENTKASMSTWSSIAKEENPETVLADFFQDPFSIPADQGDIAQSGRTHWMELWKNLSMDFAGGTLISTKKLERVLSKRKCGKRSPDQITADVLKALPVECLEKVGEIVVGDVLRHELLGCMDVLLDGKGTKSGGCNVLDQVQADRWLVCDAKIQGYVWLD